MSFEDNEIDYLDTKNDCLFSTDLSCDYLTCSDPSEVFDEYLSDQIDVDNFVEVFNNPPKVYVFEPEKPFQLKAEDIFEMFYDHTCLDPCNYTDPKDEMTEALVKVNEILAKMPKSYKCIGYLKHSSIKDDWQECFQDR